MIYLTIAIFCIILIILCFKLHQKNQELEQIKKDFVQSNAKRTSLQNEINILNKQLKEYEEKEIQKVKSQPIIVNQKEYKYNNIFEGKKAIIGNYDSWTAKETAKMLRNFGFSVEIVKTGIDLFEKVSNGNQYDIIFTNHTYKIGFNGEVLFSKLKSLDGFKTPVVIHSIYGGRRQFFVDHLGFDEYLVKPIDPEELEKVLKKLVHQ